ncbi:RBBP9/YdeN family alpha/beta hydrolase [Flavobacterium procerum]|uniref:RBBP9/YdeN family alpha/beta hydrolase n=1 Tax=Flavobacterium procerum TaxID=1455569 RepID=UPI0035EECCA0
MINYLIVPGLGNSGTKHWQGFFFFFFRIQDKKFPQSSRGTRMGEPTCGKKDKNIRESFKIFIFFTIIIGHSLGCSTIAHWASKYKRKIKGAMLVAPSDLEAPQYTFPAIGFAPIPLDKISFPTIVVASSDDIWVSLDRAQFFAESWGSEFINIWKMQKQINPSGFRRDRVEKILKPFLRIFWEIFLKKKFFKKKFNFILNEWGTFFQNFF